MLRSLAAICIPWKDQRRESVLLIRRPTNHPHHLAGQWFFPGGVVELGEQPIETARRETEEETGIIVRQLNLIDTYTYRETWKEQNATRELDIALVVFEGFYARGEPRLSVETADVQWIETSELRDFLRPETVRSHLSDRVMQRLRLA